MSPSEEQLRRALRAGEHTTPGLNADEIIGAARRGRHDRRVRLGAVAASVAAVAVVGGGVLALTGRDRHTTTAGPGTSATVASPTNPSSIAVASPDPSSISDGTGGSSANASAAPCPATLPALTPPATGGAGDPLLPTDPKQIIACTYITVAGSADAAYSDSALVLGAPAVALAASVNSASVHPLPTMCPALGKNYRVDLALLARTSSGAAVPVVEVPVSAITGCNQPLTNGVARRYGWGPPPSLQGIVQTATQEAQARSQPGGNTKTVPQRTPIIIGTPAR